MNNIKHHTHSDEILLLNQYNQYNTHIFSTIPNILIGNIVSTSPFWNSISLYSPLGCVFSRHLGYKTAHKYCVKLCVLDIKRHASIHDRERLENTRPVGSEHTFGSKHKCSTGNFKWLTFSMLVLQFNYMLREKPVKKMFQKRIWNGVSVPYPHKNLNCITLETKARTG